MLSEIVRWNSLIPSTMHAVSRASVNSASGTPTEHYNVSKDWFKGLGTLWYRIHYNRCT